MYFATVFLIGAIGYLLGSVNSSIIIGKFYGIDVRRHGSGNAGATNTLRTLGKKAAILVSIGDVLKGIISCLIGMFIMGQVGVMVGGIAAVVGHNWPVFFGFKGGKGVLTSFAVLMMMSWKIGLILLGIFIIIVAITRYVSLGSIIASMLFPGAAFLFDKDAVFIAFATVLALLIVTRHRANITRIIDRTESRLGKKGKI